MTPFEHSVLSVRDFGGKTDDYLKIHEFIDQSKFQTTDFRHRAFLHNTMGISICEQVFGAAIENEDGNQISVREIARRHIIQDCSCVPTGKEVLDSLSDGTFGKYNKPLQRDLKYLKQKIYGTN